MTHSTLTDEVRLSDQSSSRLGVEVDTYLIHHLAGTDAERAVNDMISGADGGSANYVITNEGKIILVVDEALRSWSAGAPNDGGKGAAWDRRSIAVEIENETGGPEWRISEAAKNAAAALLADLRTRYRIVNVLGHRDLYEQYRASYPTYCPGPDTVADIERRSHTAGLGSTPIEEDIMATADELRAIIREELTITEDRLRRESRLRLYLNTETNEMIAVDPETGANGIVIGPWDSIADPGKATSLKVNYALTADTPAQAQRLDARQWSNLLRDLGIIPTEG